MTKQELQTVIGQNLRKARLGQRLTIEQVSERVGISTTFYSNLECGNKMMSLITFQKLTEVLGVSASTLLSNGKEDMHIKDIEMLLREQPPEMLAFVEKLLRLCVNDFPLLSLPKEGDQEK